MAIKIAINGLGRIGMLTARRMLEKHPFLELAAINDLTNETELKSVFANDPVYGVFDKQLNAKFFAEKDPVNLPWANLNIDVVLECSGFFTEIKGAKKHLQSGSRKVIISAPSDSPEIPTYLLGVNEENYDSKKDQIISMGSCTTNAVAPFAKILDKHFGIKNGFVNTVHSYTNSQNKIFPNWRGEFASKLSIIPSTTGATKTLEKCLPNLKGKLNGFSLRVPTEIVSIVEFVFLAKKKASTEEINKVLEKASQFPELKNILKFETRELMSRDLKGSSYSSIIDGSLTQTFSKLIKVLAWYDNEWGYACRLAEMAEYVGKNL
ncbi:MAG: glyceraldehyde 3-phosphate dehydrogenase NAD-binding domain-containing protein [Candidatus Pacebacteria bacterium]|nr:glyceraldehyde 3-phosphate dehydrogenase NAD-binding domain-containing protein [Candidatus Paceibacterota bacterium]